MGSDAEVEVSEASPVLVSPIANPLAGKKLHKKCLKLVKKGQQPQQFRVWACEGRWTHQFIVAAKGTVVPSGFLPVVQVGPSLTATNLSLRIVHHCSRQDQGSVETRC